MTLQTLDREVEVPSDIEEEAPSDNVEEAPSDTPQTVSAGSAPSLWHSCIVAQCSTRILTWSEKAALRAKR